MARMKHQELLKGLIRLHILHHASTEEFYGQWMIHELAKHGYTLSPGTLYPMLRSMVLQGTHAALSSIRRDEQGAFAGLAAGMAYSTPARTYFRDGYWTLQPLLQLAPDMVRGEIRLLARGVQPDGEAPSGVSCTSAAPR